MNTFKCNYLKPLYFKGLTQSTKKTRRQTRRNALLAALAGDKSPVYIRNVTLDMQHVDVLATCDVLYN